MTSFQRLKVIARSPVTVSARRRPERRTTERLPPPAKTWPFSCLGGQGGIRRNGFRGFCRPQTPKWTREKLPEWAMVRKHGSNFASKLWELRKWNDCVFVLLQPGALTAGTAVAAALTSCSQLSLGWRIQQVLQQQAVPKASLLWTTMSTWAAYCRSSLQLEPQLPAPLFRVCRAAPEQRRRFHKLPFPSLKQLLLKQVSDSWLDFVVSLTAPLQLRFSPRGRMRRRRRPLPG